MRPALMEEVERTNIVVVRGSGQEMGAPQRRDPYAMEIDRGRNCYAYGVSGIWSVTVGIGVREEE